MEVRTLAIRTEPIGREVVPFDINGKFTIREFRKRYTWKLLPRHAWHLDGLFWCVFDSLNGTGVFALYWRNLCSSKCD
jgi:hypothetical protein